MYPHHTHSLSLLFRYVLKLFVVRVVRRPQQESSVERRDDDTRHNSEAATMRRRSGIRSEEPPAHTAPAGLNHHRILLKMSAKTSMHLVTCSARIDVPYPSNLACWFDQQNVYSRILLPQSRSCWIWARARSSDICLFISIRVKRGPEPS